MKTLKITLFSIALLAISLASSPAQSPANWIGSSGGDWNTGANWDTTIVPGVGTNVFIPTNNTVNYTSTMLAASVGAVTNNGGILNISAAGFNVDVGGFNYQSIILGIGSAMNIKSGGAVLVTNSGAMFLNTNSTLTVNNATLTFTNSFGVYSMLVGRGGRNNGATVGLTNSTVSLNNPLAIQGGGASALPASSMYVYGGTLVAPSIIISNATDDAYTYLLIDGGANVKGGDLIVQRGIPSYGLILSNGTLNVTSLQDGNSASRSGVTVAGGILTNSGAFTIGSGFGNGTSDRKSYFYQRGGAIVSTGVGGLVIANNSGIGTSGSAIANQGAVCDITGGTLTVEGITLLANNTLTNATARLNLGGTGAIYVGSGGVNANLGGSGSVAVFSCTNATLGAKASWSGNANILLNIGTTAIKAADAADVAHDISLSGVISGNGILNKIGAGTLTLTASNTYSGNTLINAGSLVLTTNLAGTTSGSILNSGIINVGSGATLDVSQLTAGYVLPPNKSIAGVGTILGAFTAGPSSTVSPADSGVRGTINFANGLAVSNANFNMELSDNPSGLIKANDKVNITGDFTANGSNIVVVVQSSGVLGIGTYQLIKYSGNFIGDITNLACSSGTLTNVSAAKEIDLVVTSVRPVATLLWTGDGAGNLWDTATSSNWLNGVNHDRFYNGDQARFIDDNPSNPVVNLSGIVTPASVLVSSTSNYTFTGSGDIFGATGLTKTNTGKLTILTANDYTGITTINGGTLSVSNLANGGSSSPIGAASSDPANLVLNGGTLEYLGGNVTIDRGVTLQAGGGTLSLGNGNLTLSSLISGPGTLTKTGNGLLIFNSAHDYTGGTVISAGSLRTSQGSSVTITALGTNSVTLNGVASPAAFVFGGDQETLINTLNIVGNNNYITNSGNDIVQNIIGSGTVSLEGVSGNVLTLQAPDMTGFTGTIFVDTLPNLRVLPSSGTAMNASNATFNLGNGAGFLNNKNGNGIIQLGALTGGPVTQLRGASSTTNTSTYVVGGNGLNAVFSGGIVDGPSGGKVNLVKVGTGTWTLNGATTMSVGVDDDGNVVTNYTPGNGLTYSGTTTVSNGVLALIVPSAPTASTVITLAGNSAVLDVTQMGTIDGSLNLVTNGVFDVVSGQTLAGIGTVLATNLIADSGSLVSPGLPLGTLTASQKIELAGAVKMSVNLAETPNCSKIESPVIVVDGTATLAVTNQGAEAYATFQLFNHAVNFVSVTLPTLTGTNVWQNDLAVNGSITLLAPALVTIVTNPAPVLTNSFNPASGQLTLNWGDGYKGYRLQVQTNSAAIGISNNWVDVAGATATNKMVISIDSSKGTVFYRIVYP